MPLHQLIRPRELVGAACGPTLLALGGATTAAAALTALIALVGGILVRRRRRDRAFRARSLGLDERVPWIEEARVRIVGLIEDHPEADALVTLRELPVRLEELADRAFRIGRALAVLGDPPAEARELVERRGELAEALGRLEEVFRSGELRVRSILARVALGGEDVDEASRSLEGTLRGLDEALGDVLQPGALPAGEAIGARPTLAVDGGAATPLKLYRPPTGTDGVAPLNRR